MGREQATRSSWWLAKRCHPDKVYHLGEDAQRLAHDKFTRLKAAYEALLADQKEE